MSLYYSKWLNKSRVIFSSIFGYTTPLSLEGALPVELQALVSCTG